MNRLQRTSSAIAALFLSSGFLSAQFCELAPLTASDPQSGAWFGESVARSGDTIAIGASKADLSVNGFGFRGAVYVFRDRGGSIVFEQKIDGPAAPATYFGQTIALDGDRLVSSGFARSYPYERAVVFLRVQGVWTPESVLVPHDPATAGAIQPTGIAIEGNTIVVGIHRKSGLPVTSWNTGAVYLFESSGGQWSETQKLVPFDSQDGDRVGESVDLDGGVLAFSSRAGSGNGPGRVHVYRLGGQGGPVGEAVLTAANPGAGSMFGRVISVDGTRIAISDIDDTELAGHQGAVHVFVHQGGTWIEEQVIRPAVPGGPAAQFGSKLDLAGDDLLVLTANPGRCYQFRRINGAWSEQAVLDEGSSRFSAVAVESGVAVLGRQRAYVGNLSEAGNATIRLLSSEATSYGTGLAGTGSFVPALRAQGCPQVSPAPFAVAVENTVGGSAGVLAIGLAPAQIPLLGGTLLTAPILATIPFALGGSAGAAGAGSTLIGLPFNLSTLSGARIDLQAVVLDQGAVLGLSFTAGLELLIR